jgi:imidazolonepropionase-like amidohydrolase
MPFLPVVSLLAALAAAASPQPLVIVADRMLDVEKGTYVPDVAVEIRDGRIARVERADARPRAGAIRVATLLPGLIDAHTHLAWRNAPGREEARKTVAAGFTSVRNLGSDSDADRELREAIEAGASPGPRIVMSGPGLGAPGGTCPRTFGDAGAVTGPEDARAKVRLQVRGRGAAVIKVCAGGGVVAGPADVEAVELDAATLRAIVEEARVLGVKVAAHAQGPRAIRLAVEAGVASIEHGSLVDREVALLMRERNVVLVPTLARLGGKRPDIEEHVRAAVKLGVPIVFGTDATVLPHGENAREFRALVAVGLSPLEALRAATTRAAALLGLSDAGAIREGFAADLVAFDGDPLLDVGVLAHPTLVVARGRVVK